MGYQLSGELQTLTERGDCPALARSWTGCRTLHLFKREPPSTISLTSLPHLRDKQYIAQAQCSHLFITPLFHGFYL